MDINKRYKQGELGSGDAKAKNGKLEINPNQKIKQGDLGTGADKQLRKAKLTHLFLEWLNKEITNHGINIR